MLNERSLTAAQERQIDERVDQIRRDAREGRPERHVAETLDEHDLREFEADQLRGFDRKRDLWDRVMEAHHFRWYEAPQLDAHPKVGPQVYIPTKLSDFTDPADVDPLLADAIERGEIDPSGHVWNLGSQYRLRHNPCGQYRNDLHQQIPEDMQMAFTVKDLVGHYGEPPPGPEVFDRWFSRHALQFRAAAAGLVLAK